MAQVTLRIVGECLIEVGDRQVGPEAPHLFALLLYLAGQNGRAVTREELNGQLVQDATPTPANSHNLRQLLYRLRRLGAPIQLRQQSVLIDRCSIRNLAEEFVGMSSVQRGRWPLSTVAILPHYVPPHLGQLREWVDSYRARLQHALRVRLCEDMYQLRQSADWPALERIARWVLELDPLNESATLSLAEALARGGSKRMAVELLSEYSREVEGLAPPLALPAQLMKRRIVSSPIRARPSRAPGVPLVARTDEVSKLTKAWAEARTGQFRTVYVVGEKSIGKTRLIEEFVGMVELDGTGAIAQVCLSPGDSRRPLSVFADLTKQLTGFAGAAGCDPSSIPILHRLAETARFSPESAPDHAETQFQDSEVRRAVCDLIASVSEDRPLLCVVEDADNLDQASAALLVAVQARLPLHRVQFCIIQTKAPLRDALRSQRGTIELRIPPLPSVASDRLLSVVSEACGYQLSSEARRWCLMTAAGNPGHLELLASEASRAGGELAIPSDLVALTDARIAELSAVGLYCLQAIALIRDGASPIGVSTLSGLEGYPLLTALHELDDALLISHSAERMRCRNGLIAERALRAASAAVLLVMHERAAKLLEGEHTSAALSQAAAWRIASHWRDAGHYHKGLECLKACWHQAISIGQPMAACASIATSLSNAASPNSQAALLDELIGALQAAGEMSALIDAIDERGGLSELVADSPIRRAGLSLDLVEARILNRENPAQFIAALRDHTGSESLDVKRRIRAARLLMIAADESIDAGLGHATFEQRRALRPVDSASAQMLQNVDLIYHTVFGHPETALHIIDTLEQTSRASGRSWHAFVTRLNCSLAKQLVGVGSPDYDEIEGIYGACIDASMIAMAMRCASHLSSILIDDGEIDRARTWVNTTERLAHNIPAPEYPVEYLASQIDLALIDGDSRRAREFLLIMQRNSVAYNTPRLRDAQLIYRLRVQQRCEGPDVTIDELAALLGWHQTGKRFGRHDDHMEVLWGALRAHGRDEEAASLLKSYLIDGRRERRSCRFMLRTSTAADPTWISLPLAVRNRLLAATTNPPAFSCTGG